MVVPGKRFGKPCKGAPSEVGKYLFRASNVWWRCVHKDNSCVYMAHVYFMLLLFALGLGSSRFPSSR